MTNPVIIAGSGRSGTTWVLDALAEANRMRTVFEPLHPVGVPAARRYAYQYVHADANYPELRAFMDRVFSGNLHGLWANYRIRPDRFNPLRYSPIAVYLHIKKSAGLLRDYGSRKNLSGYAIKFIRANLMLPWLARQYGYPTLLVVRHPCAVIASRLKLSSADWGAEKALARYLENKSVSDLIGDRFGIDIARPMSAASALCCVWCIENVLPLEWSAHEKYEVVSYEDLMMHPGTEWKKVVNYLGLSEVPHPEQLGIPSQQSAQDMRRSKFTSEHIEKWRSQLGHDAIEEIGEMLEQFGSSLYSVDNAMPVGNVVLAGEEA